MIRHFRTASILCAIALLAALPAQSQEKKAKKKAPKAAAAEVAPPAEGPALPEAEPENTFEACQDQFDNDGDGHVDCVDQDCEVFAICVRPAVIEPPPPPMPPEPRFVIPPPPVPEEERGWMCSDGIDNDRDGLVDCYEKLCQSHRRCKREIYYVPVDPDKAPGLLVSFGGGLAVPNFRGNQTKGHSDIYGDVPFHPDYGGLVDLSIGVLPVKFFGVGLNLIAGGTYGTNRQDWDDGDHIFDDPYKYDAVKGFGHVGGYVRFQWPFERFVPYLQISGGYTYARERWWIYDGQEPWSNIDEQDEAELDSMSDYDVKIYRHFTVALEPGFDVFVAKRFFAVGLRAWMPVWATSNPDVDNVGVMLNFSFTPMWRERPVVKPEYANPASTLEEETREEEPTEPPPPPTPAAEPATQGTVVAAEPAVPPPADPITPLDDPYATP
ncbi:MAG: hypothetical protein M0R80_14425 [Proteobacteria bacterium]|nr:hypothetical protein [Pseudomonadota bacterium]